MASLNTLTDLDEPLLDQPGARSNVYLAEAKQLASLSWPVAFATLARLAIYTTDTAFVGHIGTEQLSGVTLGQSYTTFLAVVVWSSAYALNSICSQAIGAGNPKLAGNWLQLALVLCTLLSIPVCAAYFATEPVVKLIAPSEASVAHYSQQFNNLAVLFFWPTVMYMAIRQFFQAMQCVMPATIVSAATVGVNVGLNALLVNGVGEWGGLGLSGSPLATFASMLFQLTAFLAYTVLWKRYHEPYWGGWSWASFRRDRVAHFLKLVVPMTIGSAIENWGYQVITFASGRLDTKAVASMSILYSIWGILWAFYWGWGLALQVRVGQALGKGDVAGAKVVVRASLAIVLVVISLIAVLCVVLRKQLPRAFSTDEDVVELASGALLVMSIDYFLGCVGLCATNVLEGMSRNTEMAIVQSCGMWFVTIPLALYFAFACPWFKHGFEIYGLWAGSAIGEGVKAAANWTLIARTDWEAVSRRARERNEAASNAVVTTAAGSEILFDDNCSEPGTAVSPASFLSPRLSRSPGSMP